MVTWAAKRLKRPVKWLADRGETFVCDPHGRDHVSVGEMAFDAEGHILGVRVNTHANVGAYLLDFGRSEEHTSELQSLMRISYAVFCLKKKTHLHIIHLLNSNHPLHLHPRTNLTHNTL